MPTRYLKSDLLLLLSAVIWGFAFVAQRVGMDHVGPFTFNGIRFFLGAAVLVPTICREPKHPAFTNDTAAGALGKRALLGYGGLAGLAIFAGASFQQVGLVYTTAGNAGFITSLYVVIVPLMGSAWGQPTSVGTWSGALIAAVGLYLLCIDQDFTIAFGDLLVLIGALFWACHIHLIGWLAPKTDPLQLAFVQFLACATVSMLTAVIFETLRTADIIAAALPILYGGVLSVGVAYTLQVVAQRHAHPAHAAILLSLEAVFAAVGGWWLLGEVMSARGLIGCLLMFIGMLVSQLYDLVVKAHPLVAPPHP